MAVPPQSVGKVLWGGKRSYSPVPRSASFALKGGNVFSSATMSSEIAKAARPSGAVVGTVLIRRKSQARNEVGWSRSAAFRPDLKNRSRSDAEEPRPRPHRGVVQIDAPHVGFL